VSAQARERDAENGAVNQALRREVNERISSTNAEFGVTEPEAIAVFCECVRERCAAQVSMTLAAYELVRRFPTRFVVKAGHEVADDAHVVSEADGYVVIEARGTGGAYAVVTDPRRRAHRRRSAEA
jgi:hypothetical protein